MAKLSYQNVLKAINVIDIPKLPQTSIKETKSSDVFRRLFKGITEVTTRLH